MLKRSLLITNAFVVHTRQEQLYLQDPKTQVERPIPIEDIGYIVLDHHGIRITQPAINKLLENNVSVIYCNNDTHMPAGMLLPLESHSTQNERFQAQVETSAVLKKQLWQQVIKTKIQNQARVLAKIGADNQALIYKIQNVKSGDTTNEEGQAARLYWARLFAPESFVRDRFGEPPNNYLNYGYAILRAATARAISGTGLLPTLGIHHHNRYNAFCLADDLMEAYRPYVDYLVWQKVTEKQIFNDLSTGDKSDFICLLNRDVQIDNQLKPLALALGTSAASLARSFLSNKNELLLPTF